MSFFTYYVVVDVLDINECLEDTDGCSQLCSNTDGSYTCSCNSGYRLNVDGRSCNGTTSHNANTLYSDTNVLDYGRDR